MIQVRDLEVRIRDRVILHPLNLDIHPGDFWLIFGPNGAGKTTLFRALAAQIQPAGGRVTVDGDDVSRLSRRALARKISYLPQFDEFNLPLTVRDILLAGRYPYTPAWRDYTQEDLARVTDTADRMGLLDLLPRDINTLSGGERKKVMLASAFVQDVSTILLDEPHTFLDPLSVDRLNRSLGRLHESGRTLVVISHQIETLLPLATRMAALRDGRLLYSGPCRFDPRLFETTYGIVPAHWRTVLRPPPPREA